jgi:NAD(P)-dependent dehydrogenase (short-subunit alcohol dehydrogenase family)
VTSDRLAGKVALITGAGSGLGRASALRFAAEGAAVACADLDESAAAQVASEVTKAGGKALAARVDVSSARHAEQMSRSVLDAFGHIDVVFANAGIPGTGSAATTAEADFDRVIAVNLKGVWLSSKFVLPHMIERGQGVIINQASMGGLVGIPGIFPYAAAKGGVIAMTRQMAVEFGPQGIRVNAICPGTIPTPLVAKSRAERAGSAPAADPGAALLRYPLRRLGEVDDVAALAVFLASDEAKWITGAVYPVDGGRSAG